MTPLVSVIIPIYNGEKFIEETIQSVLKQTYTNFELLLIDDGSTDGVRVRAEKIMSIDHRVNYFYQKNSGVSAARNFGLAASKGTLIAFLDADDVWLPQNLSKKMAKILEHNFGLVHSDGQVVDAFSRATGERMSGREGLLLEQMLEWSGTQVPGPSGILVKREVIDKVGSFDKNLSTSADFDFFIRVASQYSIGRVPEVTWMYRMHANNMHKNIALMEKDMRYLYKKLSALRLFKSYWYERKCYANMYLILAASWAGDGNNQARAMQLAGKAIFSHPIAIIKIIRRTFKK